MISKIMKLLPFQLENFSSEELIRTYIVGLINFLFGIFLINLFQFYLLVLIPFPLRTYLSNTLQFSIGVIVAYLLTRKIVFNFESLYGTFKEFRNFFSVTLISLFAPLAVWYVINLFNTAVQQNQRDFLIVTILIHGSILPLKYVIYKIFVFKPSLDK